MPPRSTLTVSKVAAPLDGGLYYISPALRKEVKARDLQAVAAPTRATGWSS